MSNRSLLEFNHDFCPRDGQLVQWAQDLRSYLSSGDPKLLPLGVTFKHMRHHSEPCPLESGAASEGESNG